MKKSYGYQENFLNINPTKRRVQFGTAEYTGVKNRNQFIFHSIFIWLMYVLMFYFTSKAFVDLNQVTFFQLTISFTLAALSIMLSNGGIGIYPLAVEESLGWYGVQSATGLAFGWVMWLSQTLMVVIFGGLSLFVLPFINRSKSI